MLPARTERLLNILFLGSDHFSIGTLQALLQATRLWGNIHVVTAGEKDVGRGKNGKRKVAPPLHNYALDKGLTVTTIPDQGIRDWQPPDAYTSPSPTNILITSSFGHILPSGLLSNHFPSSQTRLNVHPSILPQYRGAAPIQWAIANRDPSTGVSVQSLATGGGKMVDRGELWGVLEGVAIDGKDTYSTLLPRLATIGGDLLVKVLREIQAGTATSTPQTTSPPPPSTIASCPTAPTTKVRRAPKITHETVHINFLQQTAEEVEALFRGMSHQKSFPADHADTAVPGMRSPPSVSGGRVLIHTRSRGDVEGQEEGAGWIEVRRVQQAGKKELSARDWWNGLKLAKGNVLVLGSSSS
ncbi:hypothetical protein QFC22_006654 [Naganishia vaughanmartiniae]|uniref:Uncharacterized protein n=1 Tax=Naganishia vaughanmartiniae TaxID=1424756 RepID=A0ACC2WGU4_9TREE|nr:hypothetical protein QFC22_006654 [Naganishia vaughanmartiniae]